MLTQFTVRASAEAGRSAGIRFVWQKIAIEERVEEERFSATDFKVAIFEAPPKLNHVIELYDFRRVHFWRLQQDLPPLNWKVIQK